MGCSNWFTGEGVGYDPSLDKTTGTELYVLGEVALSDIAASTKDIWSPTHQCCSSPSFTDPRCLDVDTDPYGGLGCHGCGIQDCRLCGEGDFIDCPEWNKP